MPAYPKLEFFAEVRPYNNSVALFIATGGQENGKRAVATNVVFETVSPGVASNPAISLRPEEARNLMDELWRAGVRPSEVGSPGQLKATERHLEDMRTLTFKLIDQKETV